MTEQTNNRNMSNEPDRQDLEERVEQLESTISKMLPSRRDALKLGGAALVGGAWSRVFPLMTSFTNFRITLH